MQLPETPPAAQNAAGFFRIAPFSFLTGLIVIRPPSGSTIWPDSGRCRLDRQLGSLRLIPQTPYNPAAVIRHIYRHRGRHPGHRRRHLHRVHPRRGLGREGADRAVADPLGESLVFCSISADPVGSIPGLMQIDRDGSATRASKRIFEKDCLCSSIRARGVWAIAFNLDQCQGRDRPAPTGPEGR